MKLLTVNVHSWLENHQLEKIKILAATIIERDYDVIALQEVNQTMTASIVKDDIKSDNYGLILLNEIEKLKEGVYQYFWSNSHIGYSKYDEGIAILTKLPVKKVDEFYCSNSHSLDSISSRKIIGITVTHNEVDYNCYSCHINLPQTENENQVENIQRILDRQSSEIPSILLGDFNTDAFSDQENYQNILDLGLYDTYQLARAKDNGVTVNKAIDGWKKQSQEKRIDYILTTEKLEVISSKVIFNDINYPVISDHFGLEVIIA